MCCLVLLGGCASVRGDPGGAANVRPVDLEYDSFQDQPYVPAAWPAPLKADVYVPRGDGPFPGVLLVHGGAWVAGLRAEMTHLARMLAHRGYVVANVDYRTAPEFTHPAPLADLQQALAWLRREAPRFKLDPQRIGGWGYSAGAQLVTLLATDPELAASAQLRAIVAGGLPADLRDQDKNPFLQQYFGGSADERPARYAQASPLVHVSADDPPMFLYHGTFDRVVRTSNSRKMHAALTEAGVPSQLRLLRGFGHFATFVLDPFTRVAAIDFLDRHLRAR